MDSDKGNFNFSGTCGTPIDQCETNKCQEGSCIAHGSYYRSCNCYPGFTGIECETNIGKRKTFDSLVLPFCKSVM